MATNNPLNAHVELSAMTGAEDSTHTHKLASKTDQIKTILSQIPPPLYRKEHWAAPWLLKNEGKIVKYDAQGFKIWRALFSFSHTILSDWDTWIHLTYLTILCFITMAITYFFAESYKSISDADAVTDRINVLISFVLAGYVSIVVGRWDRVRNITFGTFWGGLENLNVAAFQILKKRTGRSEENLAAVDRVTRYTRLCMRLLFLACQGDLRLEPLYAEGLLTKDEELWLEEAQVGTRPLMVVAWLHDLLEELLESTFRLDSTETSMKSVLTPDPTDKGSEVMGYIYQQMILQNVTQVRGGIGATLGLIGAQLPYSYVHIVYWTIQILLTILAVETGVVLAISIYTSENGDGGYTPPDPNEAWPVNPRVWYANKFLQVTAKNMIFALFSEGLLTITNKLANPMSTDDLALPEKVYEVFIYNNCRAMRAGYMSYNDLYRKE